VLVRTWLPEVELRGAGGRATLIEPAATAQPAEALAEPEALAQAVLYATQPGGGGTCGRGGALLRCPCSL